MGAVRYDLDVTTHVVTLTFDDAQSSVNTFNDAWRSDMRRALQLITAGESQPRGIILQSAKATFFAGANLKQVLRHWPHEPRTTFAQLEADKALLRQLETLGCPVVACIEGSALGGGLELAFCAHHRIALNRPSIQLGLPEVGLGLIPAGGGITKLVRTLGMERAAPYILGGKLLSPEAAAKLGIVHALVQPGSESASALRSAALAWIAEHEQSSHPWDAKGFSMPGGRPGSAESAAFQTLEPARLFGRTQGRYPAAKAALACMVEGAIVDVDAALRLESRALTKLLGDPVTKNLIQLFFDRQAVKRSRNTSEAREFRSVGILGAGMMGSGIALASALKGLNVYMMDTNLEAARAAADRTQTRVQELSGRQPGMAAKTATESAAAQIDCVDSYEALGQADIVIESVIEDTAVKHSVLAECESHMPAGSVLASNTSTLPITALAEGLARPMHFIGLHFFSPVEKMELVEVVVGCRTDLQTVSNACAFVRRIGKTPIVVKHAQGFFTSRTFGSYMAEGAEMLLEGIPAAVVESAGRSAGMPVGPLAVADEISLATLAKILEQREVCSLSNGEKFMVTMSRSLGRGGRSSGGGYYDYPPSGGKTLWQGLRRFEKPDQAWNVEALAQRLLLRQSVEAIRCIADEVLESPQDGNVGSVLGFGFPQWTGGVLQFVAMLGRDQFTAKVRELEEQHGARFALPETVPASIFNRSV